MMLTYLKKTLVKRFKIIYKLILKSVTMAILGSFIGDLYTKFKSLSSYKKNVTT